MNTSDRITVRLTPEAHAKLAKLVEEGDYRNVSDVVRHAIDFYLNKKFPPEHIEKVMVDVPKTNMNDLQTLVHDGDSVSVDDAIRNAVREYVRKRKESEV